MFNNCFLWWVGYFVNNNICLVLNCSKILFKLTCWNAYHFESTDLYMPASRTSWDNQRTILSTHSDKELSIVVINKFTTKIFFVYCAEKTILTKQEPTWNGLFRKLIIGKYQWTIWSPHSDKRTIAYDSFEWNHYQVYKKYGMYIVKKQEPTWNGLFRKLIIESDIQGDWQNARR